MLFKFALLIGLLSAPFSYAQDLSCEERLRGLLSKLFACEERAMAVTRVHSQVRDGGFHSEIRKNQFMAHLMLYLRQGEMPIVAYTTSKGKDRYGIVQSASMNEITLWDPCREEDKRLRTFSTEEFKFRWYSPKYFQWGGTVIRASTQPLWN